MIYRHADLLRQGKCQCAAFTDFLCCAPRSRLPSQGRGQGEGSIEKQPDPQVNELARAVSNPSPQSSPLPKGGQAENAPSAARGSARVSSTQGKLRRAAGHARLRRSTEFPPNPKRATFSLCTSSSPR